MGAEVRPYFLPDQQSYAVDQERQRHRDALYRFGDYSLWVLMWHIEDFENGLVDRCHTCYVARGKVAKAYGQADQADCPDCFGTTFEGGFKAQLYRPTLWNFSAEAHSPGARGEINRATAYIETTEDFASKSGDYVFKSDGSRWFVRAPSANPYLVTGFGFSGDANQVVGFGYAQADKEEESGVSYKIPPTNDVLMPRLAVATGNRDTIDWSQYEIIRGPLL